MYINYGINYKAINGYSYKIKDFYGRDPIVFKDLTKEKIDLLKKKALNYNTIYNERKEPKLEKYLKIMEMINLARIRGFFTNTAEKVICFMFSIDPDFETIKIVNEFNTTNEIKKELIKKFGVYDVNFIKLQKYYITHFLSKEEKSKLDEEIEKRIWK